MVQDYSNAIEPGRNVLGSWIPELDLKIKPLTCTNLLCNFRMISLESATDVN